MGKSLRVLLIEDREEDGRHLLYVLDEGGYATLAERVQTADTLREALRTRTWDVIISDYVMARFSALAAIKTVKESGLDIPFIIVSGTMGEEAAVEAMKAGAHDYLMKSNLSRLVPAIDRELREAEERRIRRRAEVAIRQGKIEYEAVFDAVSDLIVLADEQGKIIRCNRKVIDYFKTSYTELLGRNLADVFYGMQDPPANVFAFQANEPFQGGLEGIDDVSFPRLKGWFTVSSYPIHTLESRLNIVHILKDVTKRRLAEEEKRISDRELLTLYAIAFRLNSKRDATRIMGDLLFQIHNMLDIDYSTIHLLDKGSLELKASLGLSHYFESLVRKLPAEATWVREVLDGKTFTTREMVGSFPPEFLKTAREMEIHAWCVVPLKIGPDIIGVMTVSHKAKRKYTDRQVFLLNSIANQMAVLIENHMLYNKMKQKAKELQLSKQALKLNLQEMKRANIELGRLNAAKNSFIGMASHELKTPITSSLGGLQFLLHYSKLDIAPEQYAILNSVYEGVSQLRKLVEDLLSISRIEAKGLVLYKNNYNLLSICHEVYESFALPLSERKIEVSIASDDWQVRVDASFARLVIRNLLENAIKFTPDGGSIAISGRRVGRDEALSLAEELALFYPDFVQLCDGVDAFYRLDITDAGVGIPDEERIRIFDKFYGVGDIAYHSSGSSDFMSKGSGLGLSIVKGIMDAHNGLVWNSPAPDCKGTVFSLLFPFDA